MYALVTTERASWRDVCSGTAVLFTFAFMFPIFQSFKSTNTFLTFIPCFTTTMQPELGIACMDDQDTLVDLIIAVMIFLLAILINRIMMVGYYFGVWL